MGRLVKVIEVSSALRSVSSVLISGEVLWGRFDRTEKDVAMKNEKLKVVRGSGNVFRDLGHKNADAE